jgi:uncharacterized delta-60 repeat protein
LRQACRTAIAEWLEERRLLSGGLPDPSFGSGGKVFTPFFGSRIDVVASSVAQPDGRVIVAGTSGNPSEEDFALARFNADGTLDTTFGTNGQVRTDLGASDTVEDVTLQPDGKILVAGMTGAGNDFAAAVVRYNADGSIDTTFGNNGVARVHPRTYDYAFAVRALPGGKVLLGGYTGTAEQGSGDFLLARFTSAGAPDPTFGTGGITITDIAGNYDTLRTLMVTGDKVIAAGESIVGAPSSFQTSVVLARYNAAGKLDGAFGAGGKVVVPAGGYETVADGAVRADGSIVVADNFFGSVVVRQFTPTGKVDASFGTGGLAAINVFPTDRVRRLALIGGGKILLGGMVGGAPYDDGDVAVYRMNANGALDTTFGKQGIAVTTRAGEQSLGGMTVRADGSAVVAWSTGSSQNPEPNPNFDLARFTPTGTLDTKFGKGGTASTDFLGEVLAGATDVAVQPDGKIVAVGMAESGGLVRHSVLVLSRYLPGGQLDPSFGIGGRVTGVDGDGTRVFVRPDGKIVVALIGTNQRTWFLQFTAKGIPDVTFGNNGLIDTGVYAERGGANIVRQRDGKLLVAGVGANAQPSPLKVVRLTGDGRFDGTFGTGGVATAAVGDFMVDSLAIAPDGGVVVGGANIPSRTPPMVTQLALVRFQSNGTLDKSFGTGGETIVTSGPSSNEAVAIGIQSGGQIVVASGQYQEMRLSRFFQNGVRDTFFGASNDSVTLLSKPVQRLLIEPNDGILASGAWSFALTVFSFNSYGEPLTSFGEGGVASVYVAPPTVAGGLALDNSNQIVIAGASGGAFVVARLSNDLRSSFGTTPIALPGTIEVENFDRGAEGVTYHDTTPANVTGLYRPDAGVDLDVSKDTGGGYFVRSTQAGEWLEYTVDVAASGPYTLEARVASLGAGGTFSVSVDGRDVTGPIAVPDTGGWQNWRTIGKPGVTLAVGRHVLRLNMLTIGRSGITGNFNWLRLQSGSGKPGLTATYYDNDTLTGPATRLTVGNVNFDWGRGSPLPAIAPDTFSARFEGFLQVPVTGDYTLYTRSDDGVRLRIDGLFQIDDWNRHPVTEHAVTLHLEAGRKYALSLEYFEAYGFASVQLLWSSATIAKQVIPASAFSTVA